MGTVLPLEVPAWSARPGARGAAKAKLQVQAERAEPPRKLTSLPDTAPRPGPRPGAACDGEERGHDRGGGEGTSAGRGPDLTAVRHASLRQRHPG